MNTISFQRHRSGSVSLLRMLALFSSLLIVGSSAAVSPPVNQASDGTNGRFPLPSTIQGEVRGVVAVRGGETLVAEGEDARLTPASVLKLVVAAAALDLFGPEHRFRTEIYAQDSAEANPESGRVASLVVVAGADPSWNEAHFEADPAYPFKQLAAQVVASGVRIVESAVVIDTSRVIGRRVPNDWPAGDASLGYGAAPSALAWMDNRSRVRIAPGPRVGMQALVEPLDPIEWRNESITVPADRDGRGSIEFDLDWSQSSAVLRGEYPISERSFTVEVATPNPEQRAADALLLALAEAGIQLPSVLELQQESVNVAAMRKVATFHSPPLREILVPLLADSSNFAAEMLLRNVGHRALGSGRLDIGIDAITAFLVKSVGLDEAGFSIDDGSGLSPFNLLSPRSVVTLLQWSWQQPWRDAYFDAMASDQAGTIHDYWPRAPHMRGKSGTLRHTQCLAGVLLPQGRDGVSQDPIFFAWMVNHSTRERRAIRREVMDTLWRWSRL